jgi:hypothetical protein
VAMRSDKKSRTKRVPKLAHTSLRGIGWHVSYRDPSTGLPRKYRFGKVSEERARILYHHWVSEHLDGKAAESTTKPGPKLQPLPAPTRVQGLVQKDIVSGSLLQIATDLLNFDEARTREDGSPRTLGTIHSRVRLNRRKMLLDFLEFMNQQHGQGCLKSMTLVDLSMGDVEAYNQKVVLAGYSQSQVSVELGIESGAAPIRVLNA